MLIAKIDAMLIVGDRTRRKGQRQRTVLKPRHKNQVICRQFYLYLHNCGKERYENLKKHYLVNGLSPRKLKSGGRIEKLSTTYESMKFIYMFLRNYSEEHAISLPGRIPGYKNFEITLLPSNMTRKTVHATYAAAVAFTEFQDVGIDKFARVWRELLPYILIAKPATDLCWTCQSNNNMIIR